MRVPIVGCAPHHVPRLLRYAALTFTLSLVGLASCKRVGLSDVCANIDCAGHGTCWRTLEGPLCECEPGYERAGELACVPSQDACLLDAACDDEQVCTDDVCNASGACEHMPNSAVCDDGDTCASVDGCANGTCVAGVPDRDLDGDGRVDVACLAGGDCDDDPLRCGASCFPGNTARDLCDGYDQDCDGLLDEDDPTCTLRAAPQRLVITEVTHRGFIAKLHYTNDINGNASVSLRLCNRSDSAACDPASGTSVTMTKAAGYAWAAVAELDAPNDPGDLLEVVALVDDPDGTLAQVASQPVSLSLATHVYRSVGTRAAAVASSSVQLASLSVAGAFATFSDAMPDNLGVGDAIEYDTDNNGAYDALAFIHARQSASRFAVLQANGALPVATTGTTSFWLAARAYLSLGDAATLAANTAIDAALLPFDDNSVGIDLVTSNRVLHFACYDDAEDTEGASFGHGTGAGTWTTSATHYLRVFTPVELGQVGQSQRHQGTYGQGYRRTVGLQSTVDYFRVDGLAFATVGSPVLFITGVQPAGSPLAEVSISNCYVHAMTPDCSSGDVVDVYDTGNALIKVWNTIAVSDSPVIGDGSWADVSAFHLNSPLAEFRLSNCTAIANESHAIRIEDNTVVTLKNVVAERRGVASAATIYFGPGSSAQLFDSVTDDASASGGNGGARNHPNTTMAFRDAGQSDFHQSTAETTLRGVGQNLSTSVEDSILSFDTDIDGEPRPLPPTAWDVGADQGS